MDLILRNVRLRSRQYGKFDVGIENGTISAIEPKLGVSGDREIDGSNLMVTPSFVDCHSHLDKALMGRGLSGSGASGGFIEGITRSYEAKRKSSVEDVVRRASEALGWGIANGTGAIRVHADVDFSWELTGIEGILELKKKFSRLVDLQIVAFPDLVDPMDEASEALIRKAVQAGADVVGGQPEIEISPEDVRSHVDALFRVATEYGKDLDIHVDHILDPVSYTRTLEYIISKTIQARYQGRVTVAHCCSLSSYNNDYTSRIIGLMKRARMNFVCCPKEELIVAGMGPPPIKEIVDAGVNSAYAHNNILDMFSSYGRMDMLEVGLLLAHEAKFQKEADAEVIFDMATTNPSKILRLEGYGTEVGCKANLNLIDAASAYEAIRTNAVRRYVIRGGDVLVETTKTTKYHY
jgi:cytosine deaminase